MIALLDDNVLETVVYFTKRDLPFVLRDIWKLRSKICANAIFLPLVVDGGFLLDVLCLIFKGYW